MSEKTVEERLAALEKYLPFLEKRFGNRIEVTPQEKQAALEKLREKALGKNVPPEVNARMDEAMRKGENIVTALEAGKKAMREVRKAERRAAREENKDAETDNT